MQAENSSIVDQAVSACQGMLEKTGIDKYLCYVGLSVSKLAHGLVFFVGAFAIGFCFKRYFRAFLGALFFTTIVYLILDYNNLISVDWVSIKHILGIPLQNTQVNNIVGTLWAWIKAHVFLSVVSVLGFLLGYKMG